MRLSLSVIVAAALVLSIARADAQVVSGRGSEVCAAKKALGPPRLQTSSSSSPEILTHSFDVLDYRLALDLYACFQTPYPRSFSAAEVVTFRAVSDISSIQLDAVNTSLQIDGVGRAATGFTHASNTLTISLDRVYAAGETAHVSIDYHHKDVADNAFYVSGGLVFTDCEPEGARKWFPCWDKPADKATVDVSARVPASVKLGSNGRLADSLRSGDTLTYRWISRDPVATYLVVLSGRVNYQLDIVSWTPPSDPSRPVPIRFYWNPGEQAGVDNIKAKIIPMTDLFSELFGEHPFEKNGFATLNGDFPWGGMENQTLTSLCPGCWGEGLISHEFAHQWFGDMITCGTWADIWLNEGFATYCESLWLESTRGYATYKNDVLANAQSYLNGNPGRAIYQPSWATATPPTSVLFNYAMTYAKGACVLHMLRYTLGDSLFFHALKSYATDTSAFKHATAETDRFVDRMGEYTGQDLRWFFDAWLKQPNHPTYAGTYSITDLGSGVWEVGMRSLQSQSGGTFFPMPLTFRVGFSGGPDTLVRVMNSESPETFAVRFGRQPTAVQFDPDNDIVLKAGTWSPGVTAPKVTLTSPVDGGTVQSGYPTMAWLSAVAAASYELVVSADSLFATQVVAVTGLLDTSYAPPGGPPPGRYHWRVRCTNAGGPGAWSNARSFTVESTTALRDPEEAPWRFGLEQNFPNPFNPETVIRFALPSRAFAKLSVFDLLGREIAVLAEGLKEAGPYQARWDASNVPTGLYIYVLRSGEFVQSRKMMVVK